MVACDHLATYGYYMPTTTDTSRNIAAHVSAALSTAGIPQRDAASRTGLPMSTLSRRLTGNSPFTVTELDLIAGLLGCTVSDLVTQAAA
jgi:lambda repressor-like predicted transcriptional regulator